MSHRILVFLVAALIATVIGLLIQSRPDPSATRAASTLGSAVPTTHEMDLVMWSRATAEHPHWHFPGVRELEPAIFGTVAQPLGFEFSIGVPIYDRADDGAGNWTTTAIPTADSNNGMHLTGPASVYLFTQDRTPVDQPTYTSPTFDEVRFACEFEDPWGRTILIRASTPVPRGPYSPFFGGVGTNMLVHGQSGVGSKTMPRTFAYIVVYARGEVLINGVLIPGNDNRLIHVMVTHGVYSDQNLPGLAGGIGPFLCNNDAVDHDDLEMHVSLPPTRFTPNPVANSPLLGMGQEFLHLMFEDVTLEGSTINGTICR